MTPKERASLEEFRIIADRLWDVLEKEGHGSIEQMARYYSRQLDEDIPAGTLYSYMTRKEAHRRRPQSPAAIIRVANILKLSPGKVVEIMAEEDRLAGTRRP